jgi:hypothetical protein
MSSLSSKNSDACFFAELPEAMTKKQASEFLLEREDIKSNFDVRDALQKVVYRNVPKSTRSTKVIVNEGAQTGNSANNNMES